MIQITEDLVLGARFTLDKTGGMLLRVFEVTGLTPGVDTLAQAAVATDAGTGVQIPAYGQAHPTVAGLYVIGIEADPVSNARTAARVKVKYATPEAAAVPNGVSVRVTGSSRAKLVTRSPADGSLFVVKYTDSTGAVLQEFLQVPALSPNTILEFTRQEVHSPLAHSQSYRRTVNAAAWQNGAARTWLCRAIDAVSLNNLTRYEVKYIFEYDPDGWDRLEYYRDPYTGKIPDDVAVSTTNDQGVAKLLPYATADFGGLGLPNVF